MTGNWRSVPGRIRQKSYGRSHPAHSQLIQQPLTAIGSQLSSSTHTPRSIAFFETQDISRSSRYIVGSFQLRGVMTEQVKVLYFFSYSPLPCGLSQRTLLHPRQTRFQKPLNIFSRPSDAPSFR